MWVSGILCVGGTREVGTLILSTRVEGRGQCHLVELVLYIHLCVDSRGQTQVISLVNKHLYPLSYFASQLVTVFVAVTKYP